MTNLNKVKNKMEDILNKPMSLASAFCCTGQERSKADDHNDFSVIGTLLGNTVALFSGQIESSDYDQLMKRKGSEEPINDVVKSKLCISPGASQKSDLDKCEAKSLDDQMDYQNELNMQVDSGMNEEPHHNGETGKKISESTSVTSSGSPDVPFKAAKMRALLREFKKFFGSLLPSSKLLRNMTPNQLVENAIDYISSQDFKNLTSQASQSTSDIDSDFTKLTLEGHFPSNLEYIICRGELRNEAKISLALSV